MLFHSLLGICRLSKEPDPFSCFLHNVRKTCYTIFRLQDELLKNTASEVFFPFLLTQIVSVYSSSPSNVTPRVSGGVEGRGEDPGMFRSLLFPLLQCCFKSVLAWRRFSLFEPQAVYDLKKALSHKLDALAALQT